MGVELEDRMEALIHDTAAAKGLPPEVIRALVIKESSCRPWACRAEPKYRYLWDVRLRRPFRRRSDQELLSKRAPADFPAPPYVSRDTEYWCQQMSWGYMQIMGAVARECGYTGDFLGGLYEPAVNIEIGCRHLLGLSRRYLATAGWPGVVAAYNAGSPRVLESGQYANQAYVDDVAAILGGVWPTK